MSDYFREAFGREPDSGVPAWDGTVLPPVGIECEFKYCRNRGPGYFSDELDEGDKVRVIAHFERRPGVMAAVFTWVRYSGETDSDYGEAENFRPARTPEQISAEERQKAVNEMADAVGFAPGSLISALYALYDVGYRKIDS